MNYIKGPDFATGGIISNKSDLLNIYETGVGKVRIRGKVETEQLNLKDLDVIIREPKLAKLVDKVMRKARQENLGVVESIISSATASFLVISNIDKK